MAITLSDRISDLECILSWEGEIDNQRIRELLGVKPVWASRLLAELSNHMGKRATRDTSHSPLRLAASNSRKLVRHTLDDYLRIIGTHSSSGNFVEDARLDLSISPPNIFIAMMQAIKNNNGVSIAYRSMSDPNGSERLIFPHAIIRAPRRWHVRAWCSKREEFRDFTLGRIVSCERVDIVSTNTRRDDEAWNEIIKFYVLAHPRLSPAQQEMIAAEYFPGASARQLSVRRCLAAYIIQDLRLAIDEEKQLPPEYQLYVPEAKKLKLLFEDNRK
ncbi:WYL domain-containing protein [Candidatus Ferrigenium straubiae]|jgi:hypothetical protein|uniref:WYL domain-containing protein n=1 Tax=Candidatus Ferrigenium straubiae TaxID=2919506 RepID=UPI003F4AC4F0